MYNAYIIIVIYNIYVYIYIYIHNVRKIWLVNDEGNTTC